MASKATAPALLVTSGISQYLGAAIGIGLFSVVPAAGVAWWRLAIGAVALSLLWRPWREEWTLRSFGVAVLFGLFLGGMNVTFYEAVARIPLGVAVSLEFTGPVVVALFGSGAKGRIAAVLALLGVVAIGGLGVDLGAPGVLAGIVFAFAAAAFWAGYIVFGQKVASSGHGVTSLAVGCAAAALFFAPFLAQSAFRLEFSWVLVFQLVGVAVLSTVIPYSVEVFALKRLSAAMFALLTALLPATSAVVGFLALSQNVSLGTAIGLILISLAVALASTSTRS